MVTKAASIFDADDGIPALKPKTGVREAETPKIPEQNKPLAYIAEAEREEKIAAEMRELARTSGYAGKSVYDYTPIDHRDAPRKTKTFTGNPETALECLNAFCKKTGWTDKDALYEALRLLGEKHDFEPLASLPAWKHIRKK